ncbi:MAG TPA: GspH/FimT family protein [Syntrophales bacterium]|nr:GspH/FimT family protein [Syntrophales bacterium]
MKRCRGFSLIEMIIVICLIGIIAAIAGLNLVNYTTNRNLKSAARDIVSDFFICKEKAISENTTYQIVFANGGNSYTIQALAVGNPPALGPVVTKLLSQFSTDIVIQNADFAGGPQVNFLARGTVAPMPPVPGVNSVILSNSRGSRATITVNTMGRTYVTFNIM